MNQDEYDKMFRLEDRYWWFVGRRELALRLLERETRPEPEILDLGCGTGAVLRELGKIGSATGLDMTTSALDRAASRGLPNLVIGDGQALPFASDSFDAIVGLDIFEHIPDDAQAFGEAFRVLRPGGVLVLSVPAFRWLWSPHDIALHHFRRYRRSEMRGLLAAAGFDIRQTSYAVFFLFPLVLVSRVLEKFRRGPARASLPAVPDWLNGWLSGLLHAEASLIVRRWSLPWGSSVVAVARKPGGPS